MLFNKVIYLITRSFTTNSKGDSEETLTQRKVYADKKSIRQSEFYQAQATGLKPELAFEVRTVDYRDEDSLLYNNKTYKIIRVYDKDGEMTELICEGVVGTEVR